MTCLLFYRIFSEFYLAYFLQKLPIVKNESRQCNWSCTTQHKVLETILDN